MANFCTQQGAPLTEVTLPNSMDPGAKGVVIGLWGFLDFDKKELRILAPPYISVKRGAIKGNVRLYELASYHQGSYTIEAITESGASFTEKLRVVVRAPAGAGGHKYTNHANEVPTQTTKAAPRDVVLLLRRTWSELTERGARTLTAQFMAETGGGQNCYNWNLGNVKSGTDQRHMYLANVWECFSTASAQAAVERANGLARIATADEARQRGWRCPQVIVVYQPPHSMCRFRAYSSLEEGAQRWLGLHRGIAQTNSGYVTALNSADIDAVAHALWQARYFTASEADYARGMKAHKTNIDRVLGPE